MAFFRFYNVLISRVSFCNVTLKHTDSNLSKLVNNSYLLRQYCSETFEKHNMKVLNVAEKHDAAKNIANYLSRGTSRKREGLCKYNKIFDFNVQLWGQNCQMVMTSVSGHLLNHDFIGTYRKWLGCNPLSLFDAPVSKHCSQDTYVQIKNTLEREVRSCNALIIWTDCDREGENIGFEIIDVCKAVKPNIRIYRAKFSEITKQSIDRALQTLGEPDKALSDAVDVRSELDLRIGAAFTRFQTLRLQKVFPETLRDMLISYGSCQFPTLGFVVERFLAIDRFKSEPYWKLKVTDERNETIVEFRWARVRLFEKMPCQIFLDMCLEHPEAKVEKVTCKPKSKWRPLPLDTIELEKQGSRKLRLNAKTTMRIAERLYTQGLISYPRTETNIFPKELNLAPLVEQQVNNRAWGNFAQSLLETGITPRQGKKSDQAHPPIHPTKYTDALQGDEAKVYEFVVRHFLACLSKNAEGRETTVEISVAGERFTANGLEIMARNYLDVYIYDKWSDKQIPAYEQGQVFRPTSIDMVEEKTSPPSLLTEAELIALMDKHGIGTDATHAEHIDTIKSRQYVGLTDTQHFMPGKLGIGLVMGYDEMGFQMSKPHLRADLEKDLQLICQSQKDPKEVLQNQINKYREVFKVSMERANLIDNALAQYLNERPTQAEQSQFIPVEEVAAFKCPKCGSNMVVRTRKQGRGKYISCAGYPACTNTIWFPEAVEDVEILNETCNQCAEDMRKLKFKLVRNVIPLYGTSYTTCIGCDAGFKEMLNIKEDAIRQTGRPNSVSQNNTRNTSSVTSSGSSTFRSRSATTVPARSVVRDDSDVEFVGTFSPPATQNPANVPRSNNNPNRTSANRNDFRSGNTMNFGGTENRGSDPPGRSAAANTGAANDTWSNNNAWGNFDSNDAEIMCKCHELAIRLTVRKEGPNKGRLFYKCAKPQGSGCDFFLWASDSEVQNNTTANNHVNRADGRGDNNAGHSSRQAVAPNNNWHDNSSTNDVMCTCNRPARKLTVNKEGPNKGRQFYGCPNGMNSGCNFFQWADDGNADENTHWNSNFNANTGSRARTNRGGGGGGGGSAPKRPRLTGGKRKCGNCGTEGHTRTKCPYNTMD